MTPCPDTEELGIMGAEISIAGETESCNTETLIDGSFECNFKCDDGPYEVCVTTVCEEPCGLDMLDIHWMQEILLDKIPWQCYFGFIGDVNGDGKMTAYDILCVRKEIFGRPSGVTNWCRFVPVDDFLNCCGDFYCSHRNNSQVDECITIEDATQSVEFIRFARGDFNGSCDDCIHGDGLGPFPLIFNENNDKIEIKLPTTDTLYSLTLDINIGDNVSLGDISTVLSNVEYTVEDGRLKLIWFDVSENNTGFVTNPNLSLITIDYQGVPDFTLNETGNYLLSSNEGIKKLVIDNSLNFREANYCSLSIDKNPVEIELQGKEKNAMVEIYNINGVKVYQNSHNFENGFITISTGIQKTGIFLIHIQNKDNNITKKIFINK